MPKTKGKTIVAATAAARVVAYTASQIASAATGRRGMPINRSLGGRITAPSFAVGWSVAETLRLTRICGLAHWLTHRSRG